MILRLSLPLLVACTTPEDPVVTLDPELDAALQRSLTLQAGALDAVGVTLAVSVPGQPPWFGAVGVTDREAGTPLQVEDRFRIGSITKTFVANTLWQLHHEGVLDLDAPVDEALPWLPRAAQITPRHLLAHRTGIVDYTDLPAFLSLLDEPYTVREIVDLSLEPGPLFEVDSDFRYSNTNYYLAAMVAEHATGTPIHELLRDYQFDPLGLTSTYLEGPESGPLVTGYVNGIVAPHLEPAWHWAAGGMVSNVQDLTAWAEVLFDERWAPDPTEPFERSTTADGATARYGLGLAFRTGDCGEVVGHTGSTMGFQSDLYRSEDGIRVVALVNDFLLEASDVSDAACVVARDWLHGT